MGTPGWIHTPYDNSTSTVTFNWVEVGNLDNHLKVAALSLVRIVSPILCDINSDGTVNMRDINQMILRFQTTPSSPNWNPDCDVTGPIWLVPDSVVNMRDIQTAILNFNEKDL